jgi:hypothetical protein
MLLIQILQIVVALGLLNVWVLRYSKATEFRGGASKNLKEEFQAYGLPTWVHYLVGALKLGSALLLLFGLWDARPIPFASGTVGLLMVGALAMHLKIRDPMKKSIPAFLMFLMSATIFSLSL